MKGLFGGLVVGFFVLGMIGACTDEEVKEVAKTSEGEKVEIVEEKKAEPVDLQASNDAYDAKLYFEEVNPILTRFGDELAYFGELNGQGAQDPTLWLDEDWFLDMGLSLAMMGTYIEDLRAVTPPASMKDVHDTLLLAMDSYEFVVDNYGMAVAEMDSVTMGLCVEQMEIGTRMFEQATNMILDKVE